jgi:hypothetical protein
MSRTYRRMKTERTPRTSRRDLRKNKRTWKEVRDSTPEFELSVWNMGELK